MSKYDELNETDCRQLLHAKLEMLFHWSGDSRTRYNDMMVKDYQEALNDAAELVGLINRAYHEMRSDMDKVLSGQRMFATADSIVSYDCDEGAGGFAPAAKG